MSGIVAGIAVLSLCSFAALIVGLTGAGLYGANPSQNYSNSTCQVANSSLFSNISTLQQCSTASTAYNTYYTSTYYSSSYYSSSSYPTVGGTVSSLSSGSGSSSGDTFDDSEDDDGGDSIDDGGDDSGGIDGDDGDDDGDGIDDGGDDDDDDFGGDDDDDGGDDDDKKRKTGKSWLVYARGKEKRGKRIKKSKRVAKLKKDSAPAKKPEAKDKKPGSWKIFDRQYYCVPVNFTNYFVNVSVSYSAMSGGSLTPENSSLCLVHNQDYNGAAADLAKYSAGYTFPCYYNPANPRTVSTTNFSNKPYEVMLVVGMVLFAVFTAGAVVLCIVKAKANRF